MSFLVVPGLDELVVDHVAKGVDDAHACEHALLPVDAHAHHLAIERNQLGDAAVTSPLNKSKKSTAGGKHARRRRRKARCASCRP